MGNFHASPAAKTIGSSWLCIRDDSIFHHAKPSRVKTATSSLSGAIRSIKNALTQFYEELLDSMSGSSVVISELEEAWLEEFAANVCAHCGHCARNSPTATPATTFLGPSDTVVETIDEWNFPLHTTAKWAEMMRLAKPRCRDDDCHSVATDSTEAMTDDDESKCHDVFSDSESDGEYDEAEQDEIAVTSDSTAEETEYFSDDDDTETKADRLLRLASFCPEEAAPVFVVDYLCPCGECPQYERIVSDVRKTVTWRGPCEQRSIIRVLQAFSTYNEVIGYQPEMIATAEECLQVWYGDEDQALKSLVMLYDEVPQLCSDTR